TSPVHSCAALRDLPSFPTRRSSDLLPLLMLSLGMAWLLAAAGVFLRDIGQLSAFVVTMLLFASAVMFPATMIAQRSPELWTVLRSEEHTSELQSRENLVCRLLLEQN